jgi:hypothetical protein
VYAFLKYPTIAIIVIIFHEEYELRSSSEQINTLLEISYILHETDENLVSVTP